MEPVAVGTRAPDFRVKDQNDQEIALADYRGKKVLLSFHPLAWTRVCTLQMQSLEQAREELEGLSTIALGFSVDPVPTKQAWAESIGVVSISLPSDFWPHGEVAAAYGIFREKHGFSERANILLDETGEILLVKIYPMREVPDLQEIIGFLRP